MSVEPPVATPAASVLAISGLARVALALALSALLWLGVFWAAGS